MPGFAVVGAGWLLVAFVAGCIFGRVAKHGSGDFEERLEELEDEADARRERE